MTGTTATSPARPGLRARAVAGLAGLALAAGLGAVVAPAAQAATPTSFTLAGRGFGHGIGMSQWGAYGAATKGLTWQQVLAFYYPGTAQDTGFDRYAIRVQLAAMRGAPVAVTPASGLLVDANRCTQVLPVSTDIGGWRVIRSGSGWALQRYAKAKRAWLNYTSPCSPETAATVTFRTANHASTAAISVILPSGAAKAYRGWVTAVKNGTSLDTVNTVMLEDYLASVVPSEMPASWHAQALASQAVAARTYAAKRLGASGAWDICDTTSCQVYSGRSTENAASTAAVAATKGVVLTYGGTPIDAMFSAYNGGQTVAANAPYLVAKADPYDGVFPTPAATWQVKITSASIESRWPGVGTFKEMVLTRDGRGALGGRPTSVALVGTGGTVTVSPNSIVAAYGLRSNWFSPRSTGVGSDLLANAFPDVVARDTAGKLWAYPGDGRGSWLSKRLLDGSMGTGVRQVLSPGDLDGDGRDDVLVVTTDGFLDLRPVQADGTLGTAKRIGSGWQGFDQLTAPGDITGDGRPDLLARDATGVLWIYRGDGAGSWLGRTKVSAGWSTLSEMTAVGDVTGDGGQDVVAVDRDGYLRLYSFSRTGTWTAATKIGNGWTGFSALTGVGDFDGDGKPDLLARDANGGLWMYRGNGTGGFLGRVQVGSGWGPFADIAS